MKDDPEQVSAELGESVKPAPSAVEAVPAEKAAQIEQGQEPPAAEQPVVLPTPGDARAPVAHTAARPAENAQVHVAPNLLDVTTGRVETREEKQEAKERRDLDEVVHSMLIVGVIISTTLMLIGIVEEIVLGNQLPTVEPDIGQVINSLTQLRPSGFLGLGLLVLVATPILRVLGSIVAFAYEKDWRFAGITFLVFCIVVASILLGKG